MKNHIKNHLRQRMRVKRKMLILAGSSLACLVIALVIVFNITGNKTVKAINGSTSKEVTILPEEDNATSFSVSATAARSAQVSHNAQLGRKARPIDSPQK